MKKKDSKLIWVFIIILAAILAGAFLFKVFTGNVIVSSGSPVVTSTALTSWCNRTDVDRNGTTVTGDLIRVRNAIPRANCSVENHWCSNLDVNMDGSVSTSDLIKVRNMIPKSNCSGCYDECFDYGYKICGANNYSFTCGEWDNDGCWEWDYGYLCSLGCVDGNCNGGRLYITSTPSGASVKINNDSYDLRTPFSAQVPIGYKSVTLMRVGYNPWNGGVMVYPGQTTGLHANLTPIANAGSLYVNSTPSGAFIKIDGEIYYFTPRLIFPVVPGNRSVDIFKSGYSPWKGDAYVYSGQVTTVSGYLNPRPA